MKQKKPNRAHQSSDSLLLWNKLSELDERAEALGAVADDIRQSIANAKEDFFEPEGKVNARMAIREVRDKLCALIPKKSRLSLPSIPHLDEITA